jgi:chromosome segregation ATPase
MNASRISLWLLTAALTVPGFGCASSGSAGREASTQTVEAVDRFAEAVRDSRNQVNQTLGSIEKLPEAGVNLPDAYDTLTGEIEQMNATADEVTEQHAAMRQQYAAYQQQWFSQTVEMDNATLRSAAEQRINEVRREFDAIEPAYRDLREAYVPYLDHLEELRVYLSHDLTAPAVQAMVPTLEDVRQSAGNLRSSMDTLLGKLTTLSDSLKPATSARTP